jgi:hypothetical protein
LSWASPKHCLGCCCTVAVLLYVLYLKQIKHGQIMSGFEAFDFFLNFFFFRVLSISVYGTYLGYSGFGRSYIQTYMSCPAVICQLHRDLRVQDDAHRRFRSRAVPARC